MKKFLLVVGLVFSICKLAHAQVTFIPIPASQFPQVSVPSNNMRFMMVYPPGGLSGTPLLSSNATISYANLVRALELALTNTSGGGLSSNGIVSIVVGLSSTPTNIYWVDPTNGSDTLNIGTQISPWKSLTNAMAHVTKGTVMAGIGTHYVTNLVVPANVTLKGVDRKQTVLVYPAIASQTGIKLSGNNSAVMNLTLLDTNLDFTETSTPVSSGGISATNRWIKDCDLNGNFDVLLNSDGTNDTWYITGNRFHSYFDCINSSGTNYVWGNIFTCEDGGNPQIRGVVSQAGGYYYIWGNKFKINNNVGGLACGIYCSANTNGLVLIGNNLFETGTNANVFVQTGWPTIQGAGIDPYLIQKAAFGSAVRSVVWAGITPIFIGSTTPAGFILGTNGFGLWNSNGIVYGIVSDGTSLTTTSQIIPNTGGSVIGPSLTTNLVVWTNQPTFTIGQTVVITGTNANGSLVLKATNVWSVAGGTGSLFPPDAVGVLTNNGAGITNWSTAIPYIWIIGATNAINATSNSLYTTMLANIAATNNNLPPQTNFWGVTNSITVGQAVVVDGTNSAGVWQLKGTNWPSGGGSTPSGLVTNNGLGTVIVPSPFIITNSIEGDSIRGTAQLDNLLNGASPVILNIAARVGTTASSSGIGANWLHIFNPGGGIELDTDSQFISSNSITKTGTSMDTNNVWHWFSNNVETITISPITGTIQGSNLVAVGSGSSSNWLGGISFIASNAAPSALVAPSGLNSITMNQRWTNNFNRLADLEVSALFTDAVTGNPNLGFTNTITGQAWTNSPLSALISGTSQITIVIPDISPNDFGSFSNYSGTGASVTFVKAWWHLK